MAFIDCYTKCLLYSSDSPSVELTLGDLYEKSHDFSNAIQMYKKAIESKAEYPMGYLGVARCLLKQYNVSAAIDFLENVKKSKYYLLPNESSHFDICIDELLDDYKKKKERGYVFKPRKKAFNYIYPDTMTIDEICKDYLSKWE